MAQRHLTVMLAVVAVVLSAACGRPSASAVPPDSQLRFGQEGAQDPEATLQPDVVVIGGGGKAVRSVTSDGLSWRLDPRARNARTLAPGKVMLVTDRGVGRVLDLVEDAGDLLVTVGPVDITEVIRDGTFSRPSVALGEPLIYLAGEPFWAEEPPPGPSAYGRSKPLALTAYQMKQPVQPPPKRGGQAATRSHGYSVFSTCCTDGVGARFSYDDGAVRLVGNVTLTAAKPDASFHLAIGKGVVSRAELEITGGFGIKVDFEAGIHDGVNHRKEFPIAADLSFPIGQIAGIPLSFTVSQTLTVVTAFGAKLGTIKGGGEFSLAGKIGFGWVNGAFGPRVTQNFQRKVSLLDSLEGVPVGVMGLLIKHGVKFTVGISAFVFKAGIYAELDIAYGQTLGSALGAPYAHCRGVGIGVSVTFGIGYSILEPVVKVINKFLSLLKAINVPVVPQIKAESGMRWQHDVYHNEEVTPDVAVCGHPPK